MTAYAIFTRERTTDQSELERYHELAPGSFPGHAMTPLALYGRLDVLEGDAIEGAVVLQFPTMNEAKAWYESPAYQAAAAHRHAGAKYRVFLIEGVG